MRLFRKTTTAPVIYAPKTVAEQQAEYKARYGTLAGIDWALRFEQERNQNGSHQ